jgi:hypothetical protein
MQWQKDWRQGWAQVDGLCEAGIVSCQIRSWFRLNHHYRIYGKRQSASDPSDSESSLLSFTESQKRYRKRLLTRKKCDRDVHAIHFRQTYLHPRITSSDWCVMPTDVYDITQGDKYDIWPTFSSACTLRVYLKNMNDWWTLMLPAAQFTLIVNEIVDSDIYQERPWNN